MLITGGKKKPKQNTKTKRKKPTNQNKIFKILFSGKYRCNPKPTDVSDITQY